jgi:hypothetical protein
MGLAEPDTATRANLQTVRQLIRRARTAGIAAASAVALNNVSEPTEEELTTLLQRLIEALEASPVPKFEWKGIARVLDAEQLAPFLNVSLSSLRRYQTGQRTTPDEVAARLHFLALTVGDLGGSYNDVGIRRWFARKRTALDGRAPADLLRGEWDPDDPGPQRVRSLARELVSLSAT